MSLMTHVPRHVVWKIFCGDTPTSPEVIVAQTLNFKVNFKFSRLIFLGERDPRPTSDFFHGTRQELLSITFLSDFGYLESFQRYSRSKSKVVKNRTEFDIFFALPIFRSFKSYRAYICVMTPASRHVEWKMFCEDTPTSPEVIVANTLNFKTDF